MTRAVRSVALAVLLLAPTRGFAFTRSTSTNGACLAWPLRRIEFVVNADGLPAQQPVCSAGAPLDELAAALATWMAAARPSGGRCTDLQLDVTRSTTSTEVGTSGDGDVNLVVWRRGDCNAVAPSSDPCWAPDTRTSCATKYNCWEDGDDRTIALTWASYVASTGEIIDADIELRGWDGGSLGFDRGVSGWYFTCFDPRSMPATTCTRYGESECVGMDLRSVLAHELGHAIGIADQSTNRDGTMYGYVAAGEISKRTLATDDVDAVCSVYPAGAPTPSCDVAHSASHQSTASPSSGGGCASADGSLATVALAAGLAGLARVRAGAGQRPRR